MKSKTKITKQLERKKNPEIVKTIIETKKNPNWLRVAAILAGPKKQVFNLGEINEKTQNQKAEKIVVPGKVLSQGEINKKIKLIALSFSESAKQKLKKAGFEISSIKEEIKKNPDGKGIYILEKK